MWTVIHSSLLCHRIFWSGRCGTTWNLAHYTDFMPNHEFKKHTKQKQRGFRWTALLGHPLQHTESHHHSCLATRVICHFVGIIIRSINNIYWTPPTCKELCQEQWGVRCQSRQEFCPQGACSLAGDIKHQPKQLQQMCTMTNTVRRKSDLEL